MNNTAYVVCFFEVVDGVPVFRQAGTYSARAGDLCLSTSLIAMDCTWATGENYGDAVKNVIAQCRLWPQYHWLVPLLEER